MTDGQVPEPGGWNRVQLEVADVRAGRQRRHYRATDHGRAVLAECRAALSELAGELLPDDQPDAS